MSHSFAGGCIWRVDWLAPLQFLNNVRSGLGDEISRADELPPPIFKDRDFCVDGIRHPDIILLERGRLRLRADETSSLQYSPDVRRLAAAGAANRYYGQPMAPYHFVKFGCDSDSEGR